MDSGVFVGFANFDTSNLIYYCKSSIKFSKN